MLRPYRFSGECLLLPAAFVALEATALKYYTIQGPGPRFFSLFAVYLFLLCALGRRGLLLTLGVAPAESFQLLMGGFAIHTLVTGFTRA